MGHSICAHITQSISMHKCAIIVYISLTWRLAEGEGLLAHTLNSSLALEVGFSGCCCCCCCCEGRSYPVEAGLLP